jgi:hypothetical protein
MRILICVVSLAAGGAQKAQGTADDPEARPPVTKVDLEIVKRAMAILDSPSKWNRADNRICPEKAMQTRFVIEEVAPNWNLAAPPVTQTALKILQRARAILDSPAKWNRADAQVCDRDPKTVRLFCAFQMASQEATGAFDNSGAAIQEARMIISEMDPNRLKYHARLTNHNNDPTITFANVQKLFGLVEERLTKRLDGK